MSENLMTIVGIFVAVIIMFLYPLMSFANKNDEIVQTVVETAVADFVTTVTASGEITYFDYDNLIQKLHATGNSYDIQIEAQILDDNSRRATVTGSMRLMGEYKYYSVYTNTIIEILNNSGKYSLKNDDYIIVNVKNTNLTIGTQLKNMLYRFVGKETYSIGASANGVVLNNKADRPSPN